MNWNRRIVEIIVLSLCCLMLCWASTRDAVAFTYEEARQAADRAMEMQRNGQWEEAVREIKRALVASGQDVFALPSTVVQLPGDRDAEATPSSLLLLYTMGYLHQIRAGEDHKNRESLLKTAARYYERILKEKPGHEQTESNLALVYRQLGGKYLRRAEQWLKKALRSHPENRAVYASRLADMYGESGRWSDALAMYREALKAQPDSETLRRRVVEVHARLPREGYRSLMKDLRSWEGDTPTIAQSGYEAAMEALYRSYPKDAERALLRWVSLAAQQGTISAGDLSRLPGEWDSPAVKDLRAYVASPTASPSAGSWWMKDTGRREILSQAAYALGQRRLVLQDPKGADAIWTAGLGIAPQYEDTYLRLAMEIASLYSKFPALDPEGGKFRRIENDLFAGKGMAYRTENLALIQRFHTILGMIYAERGTWTDVHDPRNGIFQLDHVLEIADLRKDAGYQPLPHIKGLLAEGYARIGQRTLARATYINASMAYLDTDEIDKAGQSLEKAKGLIEQFSTRERETIDRLDTLVRFRAQFIDPNRKPPTMIPPEIESLMSKDASSPLPSDFKIRQDFKILADLGRAEQKEQAWLPGSYTRKAFQLTTDKDLFLVGVPDLLRIREVTKGVVGDIAVDLKKVLLEPASIVADSAAKRVPIYLPATGTRQYIKVDQDVLIASEINQSLRVPDTTGQDPFRMSVDNGKVTVFGEVNEGRLKSLRDIGLLFNAMVVVTPK